MSAGIYNQKGEDMENIYKKIEQLRPWRYNHSHKGIMISADNEKSAKAYDEYDKKFFIYILENILEYLPNPSNLRVLDLGCLEGHNSDILCSRGFKEVVSIDLSERHIKRATFLLKELKGYQNLTIIHGNVLDQKLMLSLGKFDIILFYGLLYHMHSPVLIFEIIEELIHKKEKFFLLLNHQYHMNYNIMINPYSLAEVQIRPFQPDKKRLVFSPKDESVFNIASIRLNAKALWDLLKAYGYEEIISYDTPGGKLFKRKNYNSNFILCKDRISDFLLKLNDNIPIPDCRFYSWRGNSADTYSFNKQPKVILVRFFYKILRIITKLLTRLKL